MPNVVAESSLAGLCSDAFKRPVRFSFAGVWLRYRSLLALLLIAAVWMARSPYSASNLEVPPDSVEYALAPAQILETGHYQIIVQGRGLPPRYPPWFPVAVILPAYALFGAEPGNAILGITFFAVAGVGFAWAIGRRVAGEAGGILAGLAILALPSYCGWATQVMSDVPCAALILAGCLIYLRIRACGMSAGFWSFLGAGILVASTALFRPVSAAMLLPFALTAVAPWNFRLATTRMTGLLLPVLAAAAATFFYNAATFGSPFRNGYHFWSWNESPGLGDFFAVSAIGPNWETLLRTELPVLLIICVVAEIILRKTRFTARKQAAAPVRDLILFFAAAGLPMLVFHSFYSYPCDRFFLPLVAGSAVISGVLLGLLCSEKCRRALGPALGALLLVTILARISVAEPVPQRRIAADRIRANTPDDAIIISAIDPVFLEQRVARGSERRIVPLSREVEYTRAVVRPDKFASPDHRPQFIVRFVATEQLDELIAEARKGRRVFLDATSLDEEATQAFSLLKSHFRMTQKAPALYELVPL